MKALHIAIVCSLAVFSACDADKRTTADAGGGSSAASAGAAALLAGADSGPETFGNSPCRECLGQACSSFEMACHGEPACARYLVCIDACPLTAGGALDDDCAEACELPLGTEVRVLALHVSQCRNSGNGKSCECPTGRELPPLLRQACEPAEDEDACRLCQKESCCDTRSACLDSEECLAYVECERACDVGNPGCSIDCAQAHPEGDRLLGAHGVCMEFHCNTPGVCLDPEAEPDPCLDCWYARCREEKFACDIDPACTHVNQCTLVCDEADCPESCRTLDPEAVALQDAFLTCVTSQCISECATTGDD